ncbi:MAG: TolC family protein, partial [Methylocystis sp.]
MLGKRPHGFILSASLGLAMILGLGGCVLAPPGATEEEAKLEEASGRFEPPVEARELPTLPARASWRDVLHRAFLANGELESAYFEWKAALARVDRDATWPNTNVMFGFRYMFSPEKMKTWNRITLNGTFMPSTTLQLPIKTWTAGKVALEAAKAASERFRAVKFELQRKVLTAYLDLALAKEKIRIERDNVNLLKLLTSSAAARSQAGAPL